MSESGTMEFCNAVPGRPDCRYECQELLLSDRRRLPGVADSGGIQGVKEKISE